MPIARPGREPDGRLILWNDQPLADHSRKACAKEHQQFTAVARIERELGALAQGEQPARKRRLAIDTDQSFGADQVACGSEQRMAALDGAHFDTIDCFGGAAKEFWIDDLDAAAIGSEAALSDDQRQSYGIDAED